MKILITTCSDPLMWYSKLLGTVHEVVRVDQDYYWCREPAGYLNIVKLTDAEIVSST